MACRSFNFGDCQVTLCVPRSSAAPCSTPGCHNRHTKLCDYPVTRNGQPGTCDAKLCDRCAKRVGPNKDFCPAHERLAAKQGGSNG